MASETSTETGAFVKNGLAGIAGPARVPRLPASRKAPRRHEIGAHGAAPS
jgi:hypothetical protein